MTKPVLFWYECLMKQQLGAVNRFLVMPICNIPNAANLFHVLEETLQHFCIPWGNVVDFSSDTANVMVGKNNSVLSRVHEATHGNVHGLGCVW